MRNREKDNARERAKYAADSSRKRARSLAFYAANAAAINAGRRVARANDPEAARRNERTWRALNLDKARARDARYMARNPTKVRAKNRRRHLRDYGLTLDTFAALVESQRGLCPICDQPLPEGRRRHIDHNHTTRAVRGVLCQHCNLLIGHAREDVAVLSRAIAYLERHRA